MWQGDEATFALELALALVDVRWLIESHLPIQSVVCGLALDIPSYTSDVYMIFPLLRESMEMEIL